MRGQWWWLGTAITPWQRDDIVATVSKRYEERHRHPLALGQCPWSRDASVMLLMVACRDALVDMAMGCAIRT